MNRFPLLAFDSAPRPGGTKDCSVRLLELHIRQFRNLERISIEPPEGPVLFWGDNAQGKTNLLEAIYYLSAGRSFRTRNERECLAWDAPPDDPAVVRHSRT